MSSPNQTLFDPEEFYDPAADPAQPWNLAPGLSDDMASDDDVYDWGLTSNAPGSSPDHVNSFPDRSLVVGGWS